MNDIASSETSLSPEPNAGDGDVKIVSIIVPAYNESATIIQVLESVKKQSIGDFALEVIVH